jgi:microcystin-dependent protein
MSEPYVGEIRTFAFNFAPKGWMLCQGQTLSIAQNQVLFALLGTTYGGDGRTTFRLPDLRDRAPMHFDPTNGTRVLGESGGEATHQLTVTELPGHAHTVSARPSAASGSPAGALWAGSAKTAYAATPTTAMGPAALAPAGSGQPHENMPPYLVLNFAIATVGIFPSRN